MKSAAPAYLLAIMLGGCGPAAFVLAPEIRGRVINANGQPVAGASVHVQTVRGSHAIDETLTSDWNGRFLRGEESAWGFWMVPMEAPGTEFEAQAIAGDQASPKATFGGGWANIRPFGLGFTTVEDLGDMVLGPGSPTRASATSQVLPPVRRDR